MNSDDTLPQYMLRVKEEVYTLGVVADALKRKLFYGKEEAAFNGVDGAMRQPQFLNMFHSIIGTMSELAEKCEILDAVLANDGVLATTPEGADSAAAKNTFQNAAEEGFDGMWYESLWFKAIGGHPGYAAVAGINKLATRYPNAFDDFAANNRDLDKEAQALAGVIRPYKDGE